MSIDLISYSQTIAKLKKNKHNYGFFFMTVEIFMDNWPSNFARIDKIQGNNTKNTLSGT